MRRKYLKLLLILGPLALLSGCDERSGGAAMLWIGIGLCVLAAALFVLLFVARRRTGQDEERIEAATYLPGKHEFRRAVRRGMDAEPEGHFVIARWDIDRFKAYNDAYGVEAGDALLERLEQMCLADDSLPGLVAQAHFDGDHFVSCWREADFNPDEFMTRIIRRVNERTGDYSATICFGFCRTPAVDLDADVLCDHALLAMRSVKHNYERHSAWYEDSMRRSMLDEQEILQSMRGALRDEEFEIWFQPQYDYESGDVTGAEALVRWRKAEGNAVSRLVSPGLFIPIFEKNGFIYELDRYMWERACACLDGWQRAGLNLRPISVNVSRRDLYHTDMPDILLGLLRHYGLSARYLRLEITESAYMDNPKQLQDMLARLRSYGFAVEVDDFGSGFSSLNMLKDVQVDALKLDLGFLQGDARRGGSILTSVVRMASAIDLPVIAEGVELKSQAEYLKSIGCTRMQGYYFARPMPAEEYALLLAGRGPMAEEERGEVAFAEAAEFLSADAQSTLLFNSFLGGATILEYRQGRVAVLRANDRFFEIIKVSREDYRKDSEQVLESFRDPEDARHFREMLEEAARTGRETSCETHALSSSGEITYTRNRARFLYRRGDSRIFYESIEDITAERQLQEKNARLAEEMDSILRNVPGGVARMRVQEGRESVEFVSEGFARMLGLPMDRLLERLQNNPFSLVHPEDRERLQAMRIAFSENPVENINYRIRLQRGDGSYADLDVRGSIKNDGDGRRIYLSFADITELLNAEDELRTREAELRSAVEQSGRIVFRYVLPEGALYAAEEDAAQFDTSTHIPDAAASLAAGGYIGPESLEAWQDMFARIHRGENGEAEELRIRGLSGNWRWYAATFSPMLERGVLRGAVVCFADTTEAHRKSEEMALRLRRNDQVMRAIAEHSARIVYFCEGDTGRAVDSQAAVAAGLIPILHLPDCAQFMLPESYDAWNTICARVAAHQDIEPLKLHLHCVDGVDRWIDFRYTKVESDSEHSYTGVLSLGDVTEEHEWQTAYMQYRKEMEQEFNTCLVLMDADISLNRMDLYIDNSVTPYAGTQSGMEYTEALNRVVVAQFAEENRARILQVLSREHLLAQYAEGRLDHREEVCVRFLSDGSMHWLRLEIHIIRDVYSRHVRARWSLYDVTEEVREHLSLVSRADTDALTGLLNRGALERYITETLTHNALAMFVLIDMDDLKDINDRCGHSGGDDALRALSGALRAHFADIEGSAVCRLGGDEFAAFVPNVRSIAEQRASVDALCKRINSTTFSGGTVHCSAGCVLTQPGREEQFETLYNKADRAMYSVKRSGKHDYAFYRPEGTMSGAEGHDMSLRREDMFDPRELNHLVDLLSRFYPMVVSLNLDMDRFYLMESAESILDFPKFGHMKELVGLYTQLRTESEDMADATAFLQGMRARFEAGEATMRLYNRVRLRDDSLVWVEVVTLLYRNDVGEVCGFALARRSEERQRSEEVERLHRVIDMAVASSFLYICLVNTRTGNYENYVSTGQSMESIPRFGSYDGIVRKLCERYTDPEERARHIEDAGLENILRRMDGAGGTYRYRYRSGDSPREAAFYRCNGVENEILLTVRRLEE